LSYRVTEKPKDRRKKTAARPGRTCPDNGDLLGSFLQERGNLWICVLTFEIPLQIANGHGLPIHFGLIADRFAGPGANPAENASEADVFPDHLLSFVRFSFSQMLNKGRGKFDEFFRLFM